MRLVLYLAVVALLAISSTEAFVHPNLHIRSLHEAPPVPARQSTRDLNDQFIQQRIDNFDPLNGDTFQMVKVIKYTKRA